MHEIELKFQIPPEARDELRRAVAAPGAQTTRLRALYYDTPDLHLARAGMALRLRLEGERWVQTFKAPGGDALRRIEHEVPLGADAVAAGVALDLARHACSPAGAVLVAALGDAAAALRVSFETDVSRCHRITHHGGANIELALDVGLVRAGRRELALHEIEFELVDGPVAGLLDLARLRVARDGLWLDVRSKAERGHLLAHRMVVASARQAQPVRTSEGLAGDRLLRRIVEAGLDHILPNAAALAAELAGDEHREQARLGLAKLHRALALSAETATAEAERGWACGLADLCRQLDGQPPLTPQATQTAAVHAESALLRSTDEARPQVDSRADDDIADSWQRRAGVAMRSPVTGALWLDLLGYALVDRPG